MNFSGISLAIIKNYENFKKSILNHKDKVICFDFNLRTLLISPEKLREKSLPFLNFANYIKISDEEFDLIFPDYEIKDLSMKYPNSHIIFTKGANGVEILNAGSSIVNTKLSKAKQVDTSGAGDCFFASLMFKIFKGSDWNSAVEFAHSHAVQVIAQKGSIVKINA